MLSQDEQLYKGLLNSKKGVKTIYPDQFHHKQCCAMLSNAEKCWAMLSKGMTFPFNIQFSQNVKRL